MYDWKPLIDNFRHKAVKNGNSYKVYTRYNNEWLFAGRYSKDHLEEVYPDAEIVDKLGD